MAYIPERAEAERLLHDMRFKIRGEGDRLAGRSLFEEHGIKISVLTVDSPQIFGTGFDFPDRIGQQTIFAPYQPVSEATDRKTRIGLLDFRPMSGLSRPHLDFNNERDAHATLQGFSEFFDAVDEGTQLEPDFLLHRSGTFRQVKFLLDWLGGDIANTSENARDTLYDYAVPFDIARSNLYSPETQTEMRRLERFRDMHDLLLMYAQPNAVATDPRLPIHEPPGTVQYWQEVLAHLLADTYSDHEFTPTTSFEPRTDIFPETDVLRTRVPKYFHYLLEAGFWKDHGMRYIDIAGGDARTFNSGFNSANYWIKSIPPSVILFSTRENMAAAEVLFAAHEHGIRVPELRAVGTILPFEGDAPVPYAVAEGITFGNSLIPAIELYDLKIEMNHPLYEGVAHYAGIELAKWHKMPSPHNYFGTFGDSGVRVHKSFYEIAPQPTWGDFLEQLGVPRIAYLKQHGHLTNLSEEAVTQIVATMKDMPAQTPGYTHGDFDDYNILFNSYDEAKAKGTLIDPTPFSGSRYWDLAALQFELDLTERKTEGDSEYQKRKIFYDSFINGYEAEIGEESDPHVMLATKFVIAVCTAEDFLKRDDPRLEPALELAEQYSHMLGEVNPKVSRDNKKL